jgi:very-short-patch-repair endonuclease
MSDETWRVFRELADRQHGVAAVWQLLEMGLRRTAVDWMLRKHRPPKVHRGVYGVPTRLGEFMAATLAVGRGAAVSHRAGVVLWGMLEDEDVTVEVSIAGVGGRDPRDAFRVHRPRKLTALCRHGIPVVTPTRCLVDADLSPHELYRALEKADKLWLPVDRPALPLSDVVRLQQTVRGRTRSPAEARFILLCHQQGLELPLVNHRLNGFESDFHWPRHHLVAEVDGWEFHSDRAHFEEDRRRGVAHRIAGYEVVRFSALQVEHEPDSVIAALLAAGPALRVRASGRR